MFASMLLIFSMLRRASTYGRSGRRRNLLHVVVGSLSDVAEWQASSVKCSAARAQMSTSSRVEKRCRRGMCDLLSAEIATDQTRLCLAYFDERLARLMVRRRERCRDSCKDCPDEESECAT